MTTQSPTEGRRYKARLQGEIIGTAQLRKVPVEAIKIDPAYQRNMSRRWINDHLPFDEQRAGTIIISNRGNALYCIDGGHRLELARASGYTHVNAYVIADMTQRDEAKLFTFLQRERRGLSSHDLFRADVAAGDEDTLAMVRIVTSAGFRLVDKAGSGPNSITAIDACRYIQRYGGDELLAWTLSVVKTFWLGYEKATSGQVLKGIALFLHSAGEQPAFRREILTKVMTDNAPVRILGYAQQNATKRISSSTSSSDVAEAFWQQYNKRSGKELQLEPLTISGKRRPVRQPRMERRPGQTGNVMGRPPKETK